MRRFPAAPRIARLAALAVTALLCGCASTTVRRHPEFLERIAKVSHVGVMPPEVQVVRVAFRGDNEPMPELEAAIERDLPRLLVAQLEARGFTVRALDLDEQTFAELPELRFETTQAQAAFASAMDRAYEQATLPPADAGKYRESLGAQLNPFAELGAVDALLFARFLGEEKSSGELMKDAFIAAALGGMPITRGAFLQVALADAATGDILWSNVAGHAGDPLTDATSGGLVDVLDDLVRALFEPFGRSDGKTWE